MKQLFTTLLIIIGTTAFAKTWRVNNQIGTDPDFTGILAAVSSSSVLAGDTLHIEGSPTSYNQNVPINKRLTIIGPGYLLSGANSNAGLQANTLTAKVGYLLLDSLGSGSTFLGLDDLNLVYGPTNPNATDSITVMHCNLDYMGTYYGTVPNAIMHHWKIAKCFIGNLSAGGTDDVFTDLEFRNNICSSVDMDNIANQNLIVRNNLFQSSTYFYGAYFANNIVSYSISLTNCVVKNNISETNNLPVGNGNILNQTFANVVVGITGNSSDGQWQLKPTSLAIGAGETVNGVTPDMGPYGTADPYIKSGICGIPTIYNLTGPASVPNTATNILINVSSKSNK
jgi:hypothetical protein